MFGLVKESELRLDSPFLRFAHHRDVLGCASGYLGAVPLLASVDVWASLPSAEIANSQLFHCDWADLSQVKIFCVMSFVLPSAFSVPADRRQWPFRHLATPGASELERLVLGSDS